MIFVSRILLPTRWWKFIMENLQVFESITSSCQTDLCQTPMYDQWDRPVSDSPVWSVRQICVRLPCMISETDLCQPPLYDQWDKPMSDSPVWSVRHTYVRIPCMISQSASRLASQTVSHWSVHQSVIQLVSQSDRLSCIISQSASWTASWLASQTVSQLIRPSVIWSVSQLDRPLSESSCVKELHIDRCTNHAKNIWGPFWLDTKLLNSYGLFIRQTWIPFMTQNLQCLLSWHRIISHSSL